MAIFLCKRFCFKDVLLNPGLQHLLLLSIKNRKISLEREMMLQTGFSHFFIHSMCMNKSASPTISYACNINAPMKQFACGCKSFCLYQIKQQLLPLLLALCLTTRISVARAMYVFNSYLQQGAVTALTRTWLIGLFLIGPGKPAWIHSPEAPDDDDNLILKIRPH